VADNNLKTIGEAPASAMALVMQFAAQSSALAMESKRFGGTTWRRAASV
jgi:hypothetical protein